MIRELAEFNILQRQIPLINTSRGHFLRITSTTIHRRLVHQPTTHQLVYSLELDLDQSFKANSYDRPKANNNNNLIVFPKIIITWISLNWPVAVVTSQPAPASWRYANDYSKHRLYVVCRLPFWFSNGAEMNKIKMLKIAHLNQLIIQFPRSLSCMSPQPIPSHHSPIHSPGGIQPDDKTHTPHPGQLCTDNVISSFEELWHCENMCSDGSEDGGNNW